MTGNTPQGLQGFQRPAPATPDEIRAELEGLAEVIESLSRRAEVMASGGTDPGEQYTSTDEIADDLNWHLGRHGELSRLLGDIQVAAAEAREFQEAAAETARKLARMTVAELRRVAAAEMAAHGRVRLFGRPDKDELVREVLDLRGYTVDRLNQTSHTLHHAGQIWPDCPYCTTKGAEVAAA